MKSKHISILFIPDSGEKQRQISLSVPFLIMSSLCIFFLITGAVVMLVKNIAVMKSHSELKREYGDLLSERLAVRELISDLNRMKVLDQQIRKSLTGDLKLDDSHNHHPESNYRELEKDHITGYNIASIPSQIPVSGYLTQKIELSSDFKTNNHYGIDISAVEGTPVTASAGGLVIFSGWSYDLGNHIILYHGDGYFTQYGHLQDMIVEARESVSLGEAIAHVGNTGISSGPHLHFEIWREGTVLDPLKFFPQYEQKDLSVDFEK